MPTHTLIRLIFLSTKLKLVDLQRAMQRARRQLERDLRHASPFANVPRSVVEKEREVPEVVEAEEPRDQCNVHRAGTYIHSPPPVAPVLVAPVSPEPR
jgi:hypothetical protein